MNPSKKFINLINRLKDVFQNRINLILFKMENALLLPEENAITQYSRDINQPLEETIFVKL